MTLNFGKHDLETLPPVFLSPLAAFVLERTARLRCTHRASWFIGVVNEVQIFGGYHRNMVNTVSGQHTDPSGFGVANVECGYGSER